MYRLNLIKLYKLIKNTTDFDLYNDYVQDRSFNDKRYYISNQKLILWMGKKIIVIIN